jgi:hypothetical protein
MIISLSFPGLVRVDRLGDSYLLNRLVLLDSRHSDSWGLLFEPPSKTDPCDPVTM